MTVKIKVLSYLLWQTMTIPTMKEILKIVRLFAFVPVADIR